MRSTYKLIWSEEALEGLKNIFTYLEFNFSAKDVKNFARKLDKHLELISTNPQSFPLSTKSTNVRRCVLAKLTSIYYIIDEDVVKLITVIDNRKHLKVIK